MDLAQPSLGARIAARFADGLLPSLVIGIVIGLAGGNRVVLTVAAVLAYEIVAVGVWGRTAGKALFNLSVVDDATGEPPSWRQAVIRALVVVVPIQLISPRTDTVVEWLVVLFVVANLVTVARRRDDRRGIHDLVAGTRAVSVA